MAINKKKRRSFGAIRKLASSRYQASYQDRYGNRFTAPETFTSYEHADLFLAQKQVEISRGLFIDPRKGKITLKEWWIEYSNTRQDWAATTRQGNEHRARALFWRVLQLVNIKRAGSYAFKVGASSWDKCQV